MSLITLGLALDYKTEGGLAATDPITVSSRPFFWQQMERTRANFVTLDDLAPIKKAQVTLTDAQIKALPTTGITLVTPSSGKFIHAISVGVYIDSTSGAYTNINATYSDMHISWVGHDAWWAATAIVNDSTTSPALVKLSDMIGGVKHFAALIPYHDSPATTSGGWVVTTPIDVTTVSLNTAIQIKADNNGSGAYTGGHASNSGTVTVVYMEL